MKVRTGGRTIEISDNRVRGGREQAAQPPTTQVFFIPGPLPRFNVIIGRASRWAYSGAKKKYGPMIQQYIRQAKLKPMQRVFLHFIWIEVDKRNDPDNIAGIGRKFILDALVSSGILQNDGWEEIAGWSDAWIVDKQKPGVLITLEER